tara:strand:- start:2780 stop:2893 length:114 start_codon:yes stop_codon:yes gene_type:complete
MDNIDEAIELLEQALLNSNMDDARFRIEQAIELLEDL